MQLNQLKDCFGSRHKSKRVGRGLGSGKGKTCGSGVKGQKSRAGVAINGFEGGQMPIHRRLPKRGFNSLNKQEIQVVNLRFVQKAVDDGKIKEGTKITSEVLFETGIIRSLNKPVKILSGEFSSKLNFAVDSYSKSSVELIEKNGGKVEK